MDQYIYKCIYSLNQYILSAYTARHKGSYIMAKLSSLRTWQRISSVCNNTIPLACTSFSFKHLLWPSIHNNSKKQWDWWKSSLWTAWMILTASLICWLINMSEYKLISGSGYIQANGLYLAFGMSHITSYIVMLIHKYSLAKDSRNCLKYSGFRHTTSYSANGYSRKVLPTVGRAVVKHLDVSIINPLWITCLPLSHWVASNWWESLIASVCLMNHLSS